MYDNHTHTLKQHNSKHRSICFIVNSGGDNDTDITRIKAQFVEMDTGTFEEQQAKLDIFPPPSIVVRTRKSLHCYWLVTDAEVSEFRKIQLGLASVFDGDVMCQNESRCMVICVLPKGENPKKTEEFENEKD